MFRAMTALLVAAVSVSALAQAPANPPLRIRGTVEKLADHMLNVKSRGGEKLVIQLADHYTVAGVVKAKLAELKPGKYIGAATLGERKGALVALEVLIFPEAMRGVLPGM